MSRARSSPSQTHRSFLPGSWVALQARLARIALRLIGAAVFRLRFEFRGREMVPTGEPLIVAIGPHRNWIDPFLVVMALPPTPRVYFLGSAEGMFDKWWKRLVLGVLGGVIPVSTTRPLNREALETALTVLAKGGRLGIFPEGWDQETKPPDKVQPFKRGVSFLAARSGCRVLPVSLAGTQELWRGKTLRLQIATPMEPLSTGVDRSAETAYVERLHTTLQASLPPLPPQPPDGRKPWPWLTRLLY